MIRHIRPTHFFSMCWVLVSTNLVLTGKSWEKELLYFFGISKPLEMEKIGGLDAPGIETWLCLT